jgi:hypothetical protein
MRAQAKECILRKLQLEQQNSRDCDYETLLVETHCLMNEYGKIHYSIQSNSINLPACWEALVPLKTEYFQALAHVYSAKRLASSSKLSVDDFNGDEKTRYKMMKAHLQASQASHEEILRLQRMCRELRVSQIFSFITINITFIAMWELRIL